MYKKKLDFYNIHVHVHAYSQPEAFYKTYNNKPDYK